MSDENIVELYLTLDRKEFKSIEPRAIQEAIDSDINDEDMKNTFLFRNAEIRINDLYIEDKSDELLINGAIFSFGKELGWIDFKIPLNQEIAVQIIDKYMKKLGKLKTILEATKD